ncbi:hypothetical protein PND28_13840, partial [Lacticaseibacillus rhamnosus]
RADGLPLVHIPCQILQAVVLVGKKIIPFQRFLYPVKKVMEARPRIFSRQRSIGGLFPGTGLPAMGRERKQSGKLGLFSEAYPVFLGHTSAWYVHRSGYSVSAGIYGVP